MLARALPGRNRAQANRKGRLALLAESHVLHADGLQGHTRAGTTIPVRIRRSPQQLANMQKTLKSRIYGRYLQLGKSTLKVGDEEAARLARVISETHSVLEGFCTFCLHPNARSDEVNHALIRRYLSAVPLLLELPGIMSKKPPEAANVISLNGQTLAELHAAANRIGLQAGGMNFAEASEFANCIGKAASPAFAFVQRCRSPEDTPLKVHAGMLSSYLGASLCFTAAAHKLLFRNRETG